MHPAWVPWPDEANSLGARLEAKDDDSLEYIRDDAEKQIRYIAENSILFNVRDPA